MSDNTLVSIYLPRSRFSPGLRLSLWAAPLLAVGAWLAQWHWRFSSFSVGASLTSKLLLFSAVLGSISAIRAIYRLIRTPQVRTVEAFVLASMNAILLLACMLFFGATLALRS